jgi:DNA-binding transcriptional LysR family regulator
MCHDVPMQLDVESMRAYLAVLDWGSMTRAAEQLGLTQSAVSWKIKRLEGRVGRPLRAAADPRRPDPARRGA